MVDFSDLAASRGVAVAEAVGRLALNSGSALRPFLPHSRHSMRRWAAVAAFVAISGCSSWFGSDVQQPAKEAAAKQAAADAAKETGETAATQTANAAASSASGGSVPDINSVPNAAPVPADLESGVQPGLSADRANAQYTDETLMAPGGTAARPAAPAPVASTVPASPAPAATPPAATAPAGTPAPQVAGVSQQPLPATTPAVVGQYPAPQMTPLGSVSQGYIGTPQPGSKPLGGSGQNAYIVQPGAMPLASAPTVVATPVMVDYSSVAAGGTYGYASYSPYQRNNPAQAYYRSPYGVTQPVAYGGAAFGQPVYAAPGFQSYAPAAAVPPLPAAGQPVGVVFFNNGSAKLGRDDARVVKQIAEMHRYYGGVIRLVGHASQRTSNMNPYTQDQVNYNVSLKRANAIARALTRAGVPAALVQVAAAGSTTPVAPETMPAGEANNRRVEIYLSAY
ncbi:OmpA family protein [Dongia sp.]|uniref:OmpA family protein n=1 Tax=Dongia sp. TaxID=1977262 RepID=UPI0034A1EE78